MVTRSQINLFTILIYEVFVNKIVVGSTHLTIKKYVAGNTKMVKLSYST